MIAKKQVVIVGAGIIGRLLALKLSKNSLYEIELYDRNFHRQSSSYVAGGMLAPYCESEMHAEQFLGVACSSLDQWFSESAEFRSRIGLEKNGSLIIAHPRDSDLLEKTVAKIKIHPALASYLDRHGIRKIEPVLADRFSRGFFIPSEAHLEPEKTLDYIGQELVRSGVEFKNTEISHERMSTIAAENPEAIVFDCRGVGARDQFKELRSVRGEGILIKNREISLTRPVRLIHPRYKLYIIPRSGGLFYIGATAIESDSTSCITVRSTLELLSAAYSIDPRFGEAEIIDTKVGLRPTFDDGLPVVKKDSNIISINGLSRHGFLLGPSVVTQATKLILEN